LFSLLHMTLLNQLEKSEKYKILQCVSNRPTEFYNIAQYINTKIVHYSKIHKIENA